MVVERGGEGEEKTKGNRRDPVWGLGVWVWLGFGGCRVLGHG